MSDEQMEFDFMKDPDPDDGGTYDMFSGIVMGLVLGGLGGMIGRMVWELLQ